MLLITLSDSDVLCLQCFYVKCRQLYPDFGALCDKKVQDSQTLQLETTKSE